MPSSEDVTGYFAAACALRSDIPAVRRPAITTLLELARHSHGAIRHSAERALIEEFGPYSVDEGLPACAAPIQVVEECNGDCRSCAWLWLDPQPVSEHTPAAVPTFTGVVPGFL